MFFYLSKALNFLIHPINILGLLSILTFVLFALNKKVAKFIGVIMLGAWVGVGYVPIPNYILTYLENSVPRPSNFDISKIKIITKIRHPPCPWLSLFCDIVDFICLCY